MHMPTDEYEYTNPPAHMTLPAVAQRIVQRLTAFYGEHGVLIEYTPPFGVAVRDPDSSLITLVTLTEADSVLSVLVSDCEHPAARRPTQAELDALAALPPAEQFAAKARLARGIQEERRVTLQNRRAARDAPRLMVEQALEDMRKEGQ